MNSKTNYRVVFAPAEREDGKRRPDGHCGGTALPDEPKQKPSEAEHAVAPGSLNR